MNFNSLKGGNETMGYILLDYNITGYPDLVITYNSWLKVTGIQLAQSTALMHYVAEISEDIYFDWMQFEK